jgi:hypothetical protein
MNRAAYGHVWKVACGPSRKITKPFFSFNPIQFYFPHPKRPRYGFPRGNEGADLEFVPDLFPRKMIDAVSQVKLLAF